MIYPEFFPEDRIDELAEYSVFKRLKKLSEEYDIFYSRKFVTDGLGKKHEFEVDFIIAKPMEAIACIEVKGGIINYDGSGDQWFQNGRLMDKRPEKQAQDNAYGLANFYADSIAGMPVGWAVCFPDCQVKDNQAWPSMLTRHQVLDQLKLLHIERLLPDVFRFIRNQHPGRSGISFSKYNEFKTKLLRSLGFVQLLSTRIKQEEAKFIELTKYQQDLFKRVADNKNILIEGPAGSGKTILAKTMARDFIDDGKKVLFLCFNRILANRILQEFSGHQDQIIVETFHQFARDVIDPIDPPWWESNVDNEEFWDLDVPLKLDEVMAEYEGTYDVLIIDEGQDFKEFWFEVLFKFVKKDGSKLIFLDELQDIFDRFTSIPKMERFFRYSLPENCRNTQKIVAYLSELTATDLKSFKQAPLGEEVDFCQFKSQTDSQRFLLDKIKDLTKNHEVQPEQILILLNSAIEESSLNKVKKIGKYPLLPIGQDGIIQRDAINYSSIKSFKGLEADIVFVIDIHLIPEDKLKKRLYTEVSRGRHRVWVVQKIK